MTDKEKFLDVEFTSEFKRNLRSLAKKYRHVRLDIKPILDRIKSGEFVGDRIPKTGDYAIFKVRARNRDISKGKSAGYRIMYYVKTDAKVILITIYSKTEQSNIHTDQIRRILKSYKNENNNMKKI